MPTLKQNAVRRRFAATFAREIMSGDIVAVAVTAKEEGLYSKKSWIETVMKSLLNYVRTSKEIEHEQRTRKI